MADETPAQRRRRWLTIGETVGVLALLISAASFWDSHQQRVAERQPAPAVKAAVKPLMLNSFADDDGRLLTIASPNPDRVIQTQTILFPTALAIDKVDTVGSPRLESGWFAGALNKLPHTSGKAGRLPVAIVTQYLDDGIQREDSAIYDIGYRWRSRIIGSDVPAMEGMTLVSRGGAKLQARLDARWAKAQPVPQGSP
ncbi:MAG: hypothetical protein DCF31_12000 [Alphaproteobacteria bacterium]|nr:MAG: hypothetical protein DCF31_12000 [Alphaproteobacteria bacterium]